MKYSQKIVKTRKPHLCFSCENTFPCGSSMECTVGSSVKAGDVREFYSRYQCSYCLTQEGAEVPVNTVNKFHEGDKVIAFSTKTRGAVRGYLHYNAYGSWYVVKLDSGKLVPVREEWLTAQKTVREIALGKLTSYERKVLGV